MTVTQDQQIALDFFAVWEDQVKYFGLTILPEREDRLLFRKGKKLMEAALSTKSKSSKGQVKWTAEEYDTIANAYHLFGNDRNACLNYFRKYHDRHTDDAVTFAAYSAANLDTENGLSGFKDYADGLLNALNAITPNRFKGNR